MEASPSVPTHDDPDWLASRGNPTLIQPPRSKERMSQLEALGYIDKVGEPARGARAGLEPAAESE